MEERIKRMLPLLDERQKRLYLANEAMSYGRGGISKASEISKISRTTITKAVTELTQEIKIDGKVRRSGGGRKKAEEKYSGIVEEIREIIDGETYGDPERVLSYTTKSHRKIASELKKQGIEIGYVTVGEVLEGMGYSKQANRKMLQVGEPHPGRNAQFEHINSRAAAHLKTGVPVISVDTKKKENIGNFKNNGEEYRQKKNPRKVLDHDFLLEELGKVAPYGVYVLNDNTAFVNLGTSHDTSEFAVESISRWWETVGCNTFPNANKLYINCDSGGSNGNRVRLWKYQLQQMLTARGLKFMFHIFREALQNGIKSNIVCFAISQKTGLADL